MKTYTILLVVFLLMTVPLEAQQPQVENARVETRAVTGSLEATLQALLRAETGRSWAGYTVPIREGNYLACCLHQGSDNCRCQLESREQGFYSGTRSSGTKLEGPENLLVLFRLEQGRVGRVVSFTEDCQLDAGGLTFYWLTGVSPAESVAYLSQFVGAFDKAEKEQRRLSNSALGAIAQHRDPSSDQVLQGFLAAGQPLELRKSAAFWLGATRGSRGFEILRRVVPGDADEKFRKEAVFAFSVSEEPGAVDSMIELARTDKSKEVRKTALFWLGQKASKKAIGAITHAIQNDPDTDIKKRAVFALSQLPKEEGVPLLIEVASTNKNPVVRKQAIFWLGQSDDPRALAFFEKILTR